MRLKAQNYKIFLKPQAYSPHFAQLSGGLNDVSPIMPSIWMLGFQLVVFRED